MTKKQIVNAPLILIAVAVLALGALWLLDVVRRDDAPQANLPEPALNAQRLYEARTPYVGDATKVAQLTDLLHYRENRETIALDTAASPYALTVHYKMLPGELFPPGGRPPESMILENAGILFALVDNVDQLIFSFDDGQDPFDLVYTREEMEERAGTDLRQLAGSLETFRDELFPLLVDLKESVSSP